MAGRQTPVVFLPRFTTLVSMSAGPYLTLPVDVSAYSGASVTLWRGGLLGTTPAVGFKFVESTDRDNWSDVPDSTEGDPGLDTEVELEFSLTKRWLRMHVDVTGTGASMVCWAQGFLIRRES